MPTFTIPGLSTGQNTNDLIRKLVELEARPIKRWEKENEIAKVQMVAWDELKKKVNHLQVKTKNLISFTAPFSAKKISTSDEGYVTGDASKAAKAGKYEIEIIELASRNKIAGKKIVTDTKLPAGNFSILSKDTRVDIEFGGGNLTDLKESIAKYAKKIVVPSVTRVDVDNYVFSLFANYYGEDAKLKFFDPNGILKTAGLVGDNVPEPGPTIKMLSPSLDKAEPYRTDKFKSNSNENAKPSNEGGLVVKGSTAFMVSIGDTKIDKMSTIEIEVKKIDGTPPPDYIGLGFHYISAEDKKVYFENTQIKNGKFILPIAEIARGKIVDKIIISNPIPDIELIYTSIKYHAPGEVQGAPAVNTIVAAKNAKFKIGGIEITRDSNDNIRDALDGVVINLLKETREPITLNIDSDVSKGVNMVKEFVDAYNDLVKYSKDITVTNKDSRVDLSNSIQDDPNHDISADYYNKKSKSGILSGETVIIQLVAGLRTAVGNFYPSSTDPRYKVLSDIGITTGQVGSNWKSIQDQHLVINETQLFTALSDSPDSVRELFASDTNKDSKIDNGVGYAILEHIKPFTSFQSGIVASKVKMAEGTIQDNHKKIRSFESHLLSYEKKMKMKFRYMEQGVGKNKAIGNYLKNNLRNNDENR